MNEHPLERKSTQEKLALKVEIATAKDWETYKKLRLESIMGPEAEMFGFMPGDFESERDKILERVKSEASWKKDLSSHNLFIVLSWNGSDGVGMGLAKEKDKTGRWLMGAGYVKEGFRERKIGQKMFAMRLREISKRGGKKVRIAVEVSNATSIHIADSFGFKTVEKDEKGVYMELENINNSAVITKIDEVLNAG